MLQRFARLSEAARLPLNDERLDAFRQIPEQPLSFSVYLRRAAFLVLAKRAECVLEASAAPAERTRSFLG
jgi:hypothetical protein